MVRDEIAENIKKATGVDEVNLEFPENEEFGDFSSNVAFKSRSPREKAEEIVEKLKTNQDLSNIVDKIEVAGPGFINFWLKKDVLVDNLIEIDNLGEKYGKTNFLNGKRVNFEYGDANTHKLPHIGHIFSYIYGESMCRILETAGANVFRASYQGDIGLHVAKCLWAFKKENPKIPTTLLEKVELLQKMYQEGSAAFDESEKSKKEIQGLNKEIYAGTGESADLWQETRQWCVDYYKKFEERLGIKYDRYYYESQVEKKGKEIVKKYLGKVFKKSKGAIIFEGSKYGLHDRVFVTNYDTPTYEAKDMYLEVLKYEEWPYDLMIITTANEQNEYFRVVYKALEMVNPELVGKLMHIGFGMINLKSGKMSSRTGEIIGAVDLIEKAVSEIRKIIEEEGLSDLEKDAISEAVGVGAVKYSFLKNNPTQDTRFDMEESIAKEGNSGPYLQYTVARTNSILAKYQVSGIKYHAIKHLTLDTGHLTLNDEELSVLRGLVRFPEIIADSTKNYSPNLLCDYLYDLAQKFNLFYSRHRILQTERANSESASDNVHRILTDTGNPVTDFRLILTKSTGQVLKNGLKILGIQTPEKM